MAVHEGKLYLLEHNDTWQQVRAILTQTHLQIFTAKSDTMAAHTIDVSSIQVVDQPTHSEFSNNKRCFELVVTESTQQQQVITLSARSEHSKHNWVSTLRSTTDLSKKEKKKRRWSFSLPSILRNQSNTTTELPTVKKQGENGQVQVRSKKSMSLADGRVVNISSANKPSMPRARPTVRKESKDKREKREEKEKKEKEKEKEKERKEGGEKEEETKKKKKKKKKKSKDSHSSQDETNQKEIEEKGKKDATIQNTNDNTQQDNKKDVEKDKVEEKPKETVKEEVVVKPSKQEVEEDKDCNEIEIPVEGMHQPNGKVVVRKSKSAEDKTIPPEQLEVVVVKSKSLDRASTSALKKDKKPKKDKVAIIFPSVQRSTSTDDYEVETASRSKKRPKKVSRTRSLSLGQPLGNSKSEENYQSYSRIRASTQPMTENSSQLDKLSYWRVNRGMSMSSNATTRMRKASITQSLKSGISTTLRTLRKGNSTSTASRTLKMEEASQALHHQIATNWEKSAERLSVWADFPRIAKNVKCLDSAFQDIDITAPKLPSAREPKDEMEKPSDRCILLKNLLETFAFELGKLEDCLSVEKHFFNEVQMDNTTDTAKQIEMFFKKHIHENSKTLKLLKVLNQSIVAPPYIQIKNTFAAIDMPVKDVAGMWLMEVVFAKDEVVVVHSKKATSASEIPEDNFGFIWHLRIVLDNELTTISKVQLSIDDLQINEDMKENKRKKILSVRDHQLFV